MSKDTKIKSKKEVIEKKSKTKESTLYYFTSTGCAFCKQLAPFIEKLNKNWKNILNLNVSESDNEGLKREIENKYNLRCGTPWLVNASNGNHICGATAEENVKRWADGEKIPTAPKPTGPPPPPPQDFNNKEQIDTWKKSYKKWSKENDHLPNIPEVDDMLNRLKQQQQIRQQQQQQSDQQDERISRIEQKLDTLINHLGVKWVLNSNQNQRLTEKLQKKN